MRERKFTAPQLEYFASSSRHSINHNPKACTPVTAEALEELFVEVRKLSPVFENGGRTIYCLVDRGPIEDWADYEDYDWDHQLLMTASGKDICNWLIHSYIFFFARDVDSKDRFFYVCSDFDRNKFLYKVDIVDWLGYIDYVASDSISELWNMYDEKKMDYIYTRKKRVKSPFYEEV